jgi:hypothetical protein
VIDERAGESALPEWLEENQRIRERYDLPDYEAPRFEDGTYTYEVVPEIEREYGCEIKFIGLEGSLENWEIRVDGRRVMEVARHLDEQGNMIYGTTAEELRERLEAYLEG